MSAIARAIGQHSLAFWHALLGTPTDVDLPVTCELCSNRRWNTRGRGLQASRQACLMQLVWIGIQEALSTDAQPEKTSC